MGLERQDSPETPIKKSKMKRKKQNGDDGMLPPEQPQPVNVQIEVICDHIEKTPPIVGYFPSCYKTTSTNSDHQDNLSPSPLLPDVRFYRNAQRTKIEKTNIDKWKSSERMELVVTPQGSNVEFVGTSYQGEAVSAQLCTYALGVLDKTTQTLKIMPIAGNKIFRLEPKICVLDTSDKNPVVEENEKLSALTGKEKAANTYGTKQHVSQLKKQKLLQMEDNPELHGDMSQKIDNIVVNKEALESGNIPDMRNIPHHNTSATTPQEAYPLHRIIMPAEWEYLEDVHAKLQAGSGVPTGAYPIFVLNRVHKLQAIENKEEQLTASRIFSFITHLIKFKDLHSLDGGSSAKKHRLPTILKHRFEQLFNPQSRRLTVEKIDLLMSYVLVLTLYVDNFRTDLTDIAKDLRISHVDLRLHFQNLGCKFVRESNVSWATLPTPITFPPPSRRRRR
ncbi:DNA binding DNA-directed RNA polymerase [Euphorbia peplus]|nr:DNA binding DNA-directed RNA polymerase [Euphorbia peplus]